jgi:hypothetical protein
LAEEVERFYLAHRTEQDPFLTQCALRDLLGLFQEHQGHVVLVLDCFDLFCQIATPAMFNTLRSLRDRFKDTLSYIVGMRTEVAYLLDPDHLGEMRELLDRFVCWIGPMAEADARYMIDSLTGMTAYRPGEAETAHLLALTGSYPALLKVVCRWQQDHAAGIPPAEWAGRLLAEPMIQYRLQEIWDGLTQAEQLALTGLVRADAKADGADLKPAFEPPDQKQERALARLVEKRLCDRQAGGWRIHGKLLAAYVSRLGGNSPDQRGRGEIWWDPKTARFYQGQTPLPELTALEYAVLLFLIQHTDAPGKFYPRTEIMSVAWPEEADYEPTDPRLDQVIGKLRKKIEPAPPNYRYIVTRRGRQHKNTQGGYYFYPEGKQKV